jgi:hypothetical protein
MKAYARPQPNPIINLANMVAGEERSNISGFISPKPSSANA